jgi:1,2-diacylglycerol-3-alpha-glucose alpha-1,2-galactosyltransferase
LRREFGLPEDRFTVLCAGQLQERKGVIDFVEAARRMPDAEFVWAGDFSFGVISSGYSIIKDLVGSHPSNVHFLGLGGHKRMNSLYNLSDVMFLPSYDELFPMTILEAMICHIPILLSDLPEYESVLFYFYLKGSDNDDFISQLERLMNDGAFREDASAMAERGAKFYSAERISEKGREFYLEVYNSRR